MTQRHNDYIYKTMISNPKHIILVAGEASGDMHAAHLVDAIKKLSPGTKFSGLGGTRMQEAGVELYEDLTQYAVVGFAEVLKQYKNFKNAFNLILDKIEIVKPDCVILVDYPGFNLRLAPKIKKLGIKVIYYISPQIWAWKKNRVFHIKKNVDRMLVLFDFEKTLYDKYEVPCDFVGHPLIDATHIHKSKEECLRNIGLEDYKLTVGLLPGSRLKEIERHLPVMLDTAALLKTRFPMVQFVVVKAPTIARAFLDQYIKESVVTVKVAEQNNYEAINACDICMVASGTATLETGILGKPMVVIYKTSLVTWLLAKLFVKIPYIGLINVIANEKIVPECIQHQARPELIAARLETIFTNEILIQEIKDKLRKAKESLGQGGASERAAAAALNALG